MKRLCILLAILLSTVSLNSNKEVFIDNNIQQTYFSENITTLKYNNNTAYNINNDVLVEIKSEFPFYFTGPHYFTKVERDNFEKIPDYITFKANLYTKVGTPNETLELREYILLKNDNIFNFDSLVGYQKISEIEGYSIYISNNDFSDLLNDINYSLDEINKKLENSIQFYKVKTNE
ncbi:MAG: hypothetical protein RR623_09480 [Bacilli bacterium]